MCTQITEAELAGCTYIVVHTHICTYECNHDSQRKRGKEKESGKIGEGLEGEEKKENVMHFYFN